MQFKFDKKEQNFPLEIIVEVNFDEQASSISNNKFLWVYKIKITNHSNSHIQLLHRFWKIIDFDGCTTVFEGEGVIGKRPLIKAQQTFEYESFVILHTISGLLIGEYQMYDLEEGNIFSCKIPTFSLDLPYATLITH